MKINSLLWTASCKGEKNIREKDLIYDSYREKNRHKEKHEKIRENKMKNTAFYGRPPVRGKKISQLEDLHSRQERTPQFFRVKGPYCMSKKYWPFYICTCYKKGQDFLDRQQKQFQIRIKKRDFKKQRKREISLFNTPLVRKNTSK